MKKLAKAKALTEKEIEYNGRQAYYIEVEGELITPENYHTFINDIDYTLLKKRKRYKSMFNEYKKTIIKLPLFRIE